MDWYRYDANTGEYLGIGKLNKDPLNPGEYYPLLNATPEKPPVPEKDQAAIFKNNHWQIIEDHRKKTVYCKSDKSELEIKDLGPIPETHTELKPGEFDEWNEAQAQWVHNSEKEHEHKADNERAWAMSELSLSDRCLTPDFPITEEGKLQITEYRRLLRNPARSECKDFPDPSWRPQWPEGVKRPAG